MKKTIKTVGYIFAPILILLLSSSIFEQKGAASIAPRHGYGSITGKVLYSKGPVRKVQNIIKDEHTCGSADIIDQSLLISAEGGVQWAVVSISSEIEGGQPLSSLKSKKLLDQSGCVFDPHIVLVPVNEPLTISNNDPTLHNVRTVSFFNDNFNKAQLYIPGMPAAKDEVSFSEPEIIESVCDVHGWMKAFIHVVDHPYHNVTSESGTFELDSIPPGQYTLKVWHETLGEKEETVKVRANEETKTNFEF